MTTPTLENLPMDVRDRLLCTLPDEESLKAAVLSCKALHEAYELHKKSINTEVFRNRLAEAKERLGRCRAQELGEKLGCIRRFGDGQVDDNGIIGVY
ncbi:hypothetical protein SCHPADRAFT_475542 [Schizopora paradoxa]|uniref:F-box domain-containing protein n=1 Tax=Schizopora paradoxa TaxID=27342 RepID=A0A0H2RIA2_9AGAM|nr:hypothetical protein SCHPADRAFT_475542 [Schizopora paradoxa]